METISNIANTATSTVTNIIYGQPEKNNETGGKEPISGQQGKGTLTQPYDQGNAETPVATPGLAGDSSKSEDFLKLNPEIGKTTEGDASTTNHATTSKDTGIPVLPLNPEESTMSGATSTTTSTTQPGASGTEWKPTALDEVKPSGAPGAGPPAPEYTPATPDLGTTATKESKVEESKDTEKSTEGVTKSTEDVAKKHPGQGEDKKIEDIIKPTPESEHSVPDAEVNDPHSKMEKKTIQRTDATKPAHDGTEADDVVKEHSAHKHEKKTEEAGQSSPRHTSESSATKGEEKDSKMSNLKEKLKTKLHIGSKDK